MEKRLIYKNPDIHFWHSNILKNAQRALLDAERLKLMHFQATPNYVEDTHGQVNEKDIIERSNERGKLEKKSRRENRKSF